MTQAQAILSGAILIAIAIFVTNASRPAAAFNSGPFMLMHHSNTGANVGVFRIDSLTGDVSYCFLPSGSNGQNIVCSKPTN